MRKGREKIRTQERAGRKRKIRKRRKIGGKRIERSKAKIDFILASSFTLSLFNGLEK